MPLTIHLSPDVERQLAELADEFDVPLELYVDHLLTEKVLDSRLRPRMLAVHRADRSGIGVPFRLFYQISYDVTDGRQEMTFYHPGGTIRVEDPDLRQLADDYQNNKLFRIQEYDPTGQVAPDKEAHIVERVTITRTDPPLSLANDLLFGGR